MSVTQSTLRGEGHAAWLVEERRVGRLRHHLANGLGVLEAGRGALPALDPVAHRSAAHTSPEPSRATATRRIVVNVPASSGSPKVRTG